VPGRGGGGLSFGRGAVIFGRRHQIRMRVEDEFGRVHASADARARRAGAERDAEVARAREEMEVFRRTLPP
jgi:hypothetical protein